MNESADTPKSAGPGHPCEWRGFTLRALLVFGGIAPFLPAWTEGIPGLAGFGRALDAWFSFQCHREAARSFGASAVCTRCLGIYVGLALGALLVRPRLAPKAHVLWMLAASVALVADVVSEALGIRASSAPLRFVTGFALAYPAGVSLVRAFTQRGPAGAVS
ncbi:MAG TPA: DUF2085 domain-containing protein [Polyangiaceae bacterium]